jgi:anti-sigma factor RsiW
MTGSLRRSRACDTLAEQRSALVDGALDDADRERVLAHLIDCAACRAEVAELRRLRRLLNTRATPDAPPSFDLSDRLVAIAGAEAREPLLATPFRRTGAAALRPRRRRRARALAAAGTAGATAVLVASVGLAAAPPSATRITDPTVGAQAEFGALTAQLPLADSIGSVLMASGQHLGGSLTTASVWAAGPTTDPSAPLELDEAAALGVLRRAATAAGQVSFRGTQWFQVLNGGQVLRGQLSVETRISDGRELAVYDSGQRLVRTVGADTTSRAADFDELDLLAENYLLAGSRGAMVAGRSATVVSALRSTGRTAARWWVDDDSGLLLWHQTYDQAGRVTLSAGFTTVRIGEADPIGHLSTKPSVPVTSTSLTLANTVRLAAEGWLCPEEIEGLSLVRLRTDSATTPTVLHLAYTDGLSTVSVFEQRGELSQAPAGTSWDNEVGAYVRGGAAKIATWQSGTTVFTVVTDGSSDLLASAVDALPHEATPPRTTIERVRAGWSRILESVTG